MTETLTINANVVHETIDGEAILIHMGTGTYYSLDGAAGEVWELLKTGGPSSGIVVSLQERYGADPKLIEETVLELIDRLREEDLIADRGAASEEAPNGNGTAGLGPAGSFEPPVLRRYTDMQEFILLDPIHDVPEDSGWPNAKPD